MVVTLSALVLGPLCTTLSAKAYFSNSVTWRYFRTLLIFPLQYDLPGVFQSNTSHAVNGSLWTLQHEVRCYLVIAGLGFLGILQPRVMTALFLCFTAILAYGALCGDKPPATLFGMRWVKLSFATHLAFLFSGGALVYMFHREVPRHIGLLTACFLLMIFSTRLPDAWGNILFDLALMYSIIYIGFLSLPILSQFGYFGDFSYGLYLYAFPMQQLALHLMQGDKTPFVPFMLLSFTATLLCAIASWHFVEKPALAYKR